MLFYIITHFLAHFLGKGATTFPMKHNLRIEPVAGQIKLRSRSRNPPMGSPYGTDSTAVSQRPFAPHPGNMSSSVCFPHSHLSNLPGSCSSFPSEREAQDCQRWAFLLGPPAGLPQGLTLETKITDRTDPQLLRGHMSDCLACFTNIWLKLSF